MTDSDVINDEFGDEIDWESLLANLPDDPNLFECDSPVNDSSTNSADCTGNSTSWIGDLEDMLMNDDEDRTEKEVDLEFYNEFLSNVLVDSPEAGSVDVSGDKDSDVSSGDKNSNVSDDDDKNFDVSDEIVKKRSVSEVEKDGEDDEHDPDSKRRKRQLRNRDAAVRSRERKKEYVRDLEMKSRYLEGECRRLGHLLQSCFAENQALRFSLLHKDKAFDASMAKQESAVLLLESLLLGSLLWLMGISSPFILPMLLFQSTLVRKATKGQARVGLIREARNSIISAFSIIPAFIRSKRCRGSWTKMKLNFAALPSFAFRHITLLFSR